jgi:hypothetical protein
MTSPFPGAFHLARLQLTRRSNLGGAGLPINFRLPLNLPGIEPSMDFARGFMGSQVTSAPQNPWRKGLQPAQPAADGYPST